jgi:N utilization substance protein B
MTNSNNQPKPSERRKARRYAVQALYEWQLSENDPSDIEQQFLEEHSFKKVDTEYFIELLNAIPENQIALDELLQKHMVRTVVSVDPVERAIIRIACYELKNRIDVPYKVVINEAIELAKTFGATDGHKFVNGVVDKLAIELRSAEFNHQKSTKTGDKD